MYKVVKHFVDLQDDNYEYNEGDRYPRMGLEVSEERFNELASEDNKRGIVLIKKVNNNKKKKVVEEDNAGGTVQGTE